MNAPPVVSFGAPLAHTPGSWFVAAFGLLVCAVVPLRAQAPIDAEVVRARVEAYRASGAFFAAGHRLGATAALPDFYLAREFEPVWIEPLGQWGSNAAAAMSVLGEASGHGLDPDDYHRKQLAELATRVRNGTATSADRVDAEMMLTDALLMLGSHLLLGRVDPARVEAEWIANRRSARLDELLGETLSSPGGVSEWATRTAPEQPEYARLVQALAHLRSAEQGGGWGRITEGPTLRVDSTSARVVAVRTRLALSTDSLERELAVAGGADSPRFDADLQAAVRRFQARHGLDDDGAVGTRTQEALNVSASERVAQTIVNLERWRWLPADLGRRHVRVNIAAFETEVWDADTVALRLRSIVGREYRMTPSFNGSMRYLVLAPYWHVPPTIARVDKFPEIQRDPGYVAASRMTLSSVETNAPVDPFSVDWSAMSGAEFNRRFRLRQEPGPTNALGDVKFMFPNRHNVYLHDTPGRDLFSRVARDFSSGCIRVERPLELAEYLLADQPGWTSQRIRQVVAGGVERAVNLSTPVPVYLLYFTAFVDGEGAVHFRPDIYDRDTAVLAALAADRPGA